MYETGLTFNDRKMPCAGRINPTMDCGACSDCFDCNCNCNDCGTDGGGCDCNCDCH